MVTRDVASPPEPSFAVLEESSTADLVRGAVDEARELVRLEIELAKEEAKDELRHLKGAAIAVGIALVASVLVLCLLSMALVLALGAAPVAALLVALGFFVIVGLAGGIGYAVLPKSPLEKTRHRFENDVNQLKEHIA